MSATLVQAAERVAGPNRAAAGHAWGRASSCKQLLDGHVVSASCSRRGSCTAQPPHGAEPVRCRPWRGAGLGGGGLGLDWAPSCQGRGRIGLARRRAAGGPWPNCFSPRRTPYARTPSTRHAHTLLHQACSPYHTVLPSSLTARKPLCSVVGPRSQTPVRFRLARNPPVRALACSPPPAWVWAWAPPPPCSCRSPSSSCAPTTRGRRLSGTSWRATMSSRRRPTAPSSSQVGGGGGGQARGGGGGGGGGGESGGAR